jgi:release factor glutamine methyltransferase
MALTLVQAWKDARDRLTAAGLDGPVIDARLLVEAAAGASRTDILTDPQRPLTDEQAAELDGYLTRRERREPVHQILGRKGFWNIVLQVNRDVLTPRADTEALVDACLKAFPERQSFSILDLGVGSGAILLAILAERPAARGLGVDVSSEALAVARDNAARLGLAGRAAFLRSDWTTGLESESFDLVVANPPYIPTAQIATLDPEVREHEPLAALDGGPDGLDAYRELAPQILRVLKSGGPFVLEVGVGQSEAVKSLMAAAGGDSLIVLPDYGGRDRVVAGRKKPLGNAGGIR